MSDYEQAYQSAVSFLLESIILLCFVLVLEYYGWELMKKYCCCKPTATEPPRPLRPGSTSSPERIDDRPNQQEEFDQQEVTTPPVPRLIPPSAPPDARIETQHFDQPPSYEEVVKGAVDNKLPTEETPL